MCLLFLFVYDFCIYYFSKIGLLYGSKIELAKAEGTVIVKNSQDKNVKTKDGIKLHDGYNIDTSLKSFAYLGLDKNRLVKMGENSNADIKGKGKKLTIDLNKGNLFFNIEKKLKKNESFTITTSTMTMGIRGTAGYVTVYNANHALFSVLEGKVECMVYDPKTFEMRTAVVEGGHQVEITISQEGIITIHPSEIIEKDIPEYVKTEILKNQPLQTRIQNENNGLNLNIIIQNASENNTFETDAFKTEASETEASETDASPKQLSFTDLGNAKVGDVVTFGSYPQTNSGTQKEPIEWYVIEKSGNNALLLSTFGLLIYKRKMIISTILFAVLFLTSVIICMVFYENGYVLHILWLPLGLFLFYVTNIVYQYLHSVYEKRRVAGLFKKYVAPEVVNEILARQNAEELIRDGHLIDIAVLFVDIRGFTSMSEFMDPNEIVAILNRYLTFISDCIFEQEGTLDKFIGDAAMAFWGAPIPQEDYVMKAVKAAISMKEGAEKLSKDIQDKYGKTLAFGIGIHVGKALVGNIGSVKRMDYTAIGDTVNTASRLESIAPPNTIYLSKEVIGRLGERIECEKLSENIVIKGKAEPMEVYSLLKILNE